MIYQLRFVLRSYSQSKKGIRRHSSLFTYPERKDSQSCYHSFRSLIGEAQAAMNISMCARSAERFLSAQGLCVGTCRSITQESGSFPKVPNLILKSTLRPGRQNV